MNIKNEIEKLEIMEMDLKAKYKMVSDYDTQLEFKTVIENIERTLDSMYYLEGEVLNEN